jgi:DNA invertase Pin-like site-specific DNA recombinase
MNQHVIIYIRQYSNRTRTDAELRKAVESRGDVLVSVYCDDGRIAGRGKYSGWRALLKNLGSVDQVLVGGASDLPGRTVNDLLAILSTLGDHRVGLYLHQEGVDTDAGSAAIVALIEAYRREKLSEAIRNGQARAQAAGKKLGRPKVPDAVRRRIQTALANGGGIRPIARKYSVSPGSVINIRRMMTAWHRVGHQAG